MREADNLPPSCAVVTKSGNLNFLEPSGPLRACYGTALPLLGLRSCPSHKCGFRKCAAAASWSATVLICAPACNQMVTPFCYFSVNLSFLCLFLYKKEGLILFDDDGQSFSNKFSPGDEIMKTPQLLQFSDAS